MSNSIPKAVFVVIVVYCLLLHYRHFFASLINFLWILHTLMCYGAMLVGK